MVFCETESIFGDIAYFYQKLASFVVPFVFLVCKIADVDIYFSNSLRWTAKLFMAVERLLESLLWNGKHIR